LRLSSYHWRRTIYPPMKGSGHVTLDCCTPRGTPLMRDKLGPLRLTDALRLQVTLLEL
jgi:ribosomal protein RSM22 (predicted rRNA methylase)